MARERIHKLAADWGVKSKDIIERLEKMGVRGKKAQSVLDESTAERVKVEMGIGVRGPEVGTVKVVDDLVSDANTAGKVHRTITETVVKPGIVRRRTKKERVSAGSADTVTGHTLPVESASAPTGLSSAHALLAEFTDNEFAYAAQPLDADELTAVSAAPEIVEQVEPVQPEPEPEVVEPEAAEEPAEEEAPDADEVEKSVVVEEVDEIAEELLTAAEQAEQAERERQEAEKAEEAAREAVSGPKVLGKIDLKKQATPATPAKTEGETPATEGGAEDKKGRKRRRKVVQKEDLFDAMEKSFQARQRPRKKRAMPGQKVKQTEVTTPKASKRVIKIHEVTSAGELAKAMGIKSGEVLGALMKLGVMKSINDALDVDTATLVADEFEYTVENTAVNVDELLEQTADVAKGEGEKLPRPPVVTVMGHVDHGKTSLLDAIRASNVTASESGGITQHIGAYLVSTGHGDICFLDTPGHAAFTAMRARGASVTDIVILVVAADDGVMPQTIEAIDHAKAAGNPVIVAVNKADKPDANPDRVKQQLAEHGLQPEDWGGDTQCYMVSAIRRTGIDELLEGVSLLAQILELTAVREMKASGTVIEGRLDKGRGPVVTLLVQEGTLERGDVFVCGETTGRIRAMNDHDGKPVQSAAPSTPVEVTGLDGVPDAGDSFIVVEDANKAQQVAEFRRESARKAQLAASTRMSLEDLQDQIAAGDVGELKVIVKADVRGSAEAVSQALEKLSTAEVSVDVIHTGVGSITESDVQLGVASDAIVIGFHVRPEAKARALADRENVELRLHTVIYEAVDEVKSALEGMLTPDLKEAIEGRAEIREIFNVPGGVTIGGSYVNEGRIVRNGQCRLLRDNVVVHTGKIGSLRRFKDDVREVQSGYECGIGIDRYNDIKPGDVIECYRIEEVRRTLEQSPARQAEAVE